MFGMHSGLHHHYVPLFLISSKKDTVNYIVRSTYETMRRRLMGLIGFALALTLVYWSLRFARADWLSKDRTRDSIKAALLLAPDNWEYDSDWAEIAPADALMALRRAVQLNQLNPFLRLELAASAEKEGYYAEAETSLITSATLDREAAPRTLLAQFYFRRHNAKAFWPAAKAALEITQESPVELFQDCWSLTSDGKFIQENAIPNRSKVLIEYLEFLLTENHLDAAQPVALNIMALCCSDRDSLRSSLMDYIDRLTAHNSPETAVMVWNWLTTKKLIPNDPLAPEVGKWVTNGHFAVHLIRITFSGRQPERCELLSEYVALWPGRRYTLRTKYTSFGVDVNAGLRWHLTMPVGDDLLKSEPAAKADEILSFAGPKEPTVGRLALDYDRPVGTAKIEGTVELHQVYGGIE
jgi:hypothetical protein